MSATTIADVPIIAPNFLQAVHTLRKLVRNPMEAWPSDIYTDPLTVTRLLGKNTVFVSDPDLVQQVLVDDSDSFIKAEPMRRALEPALGQGILTAEGQRWRLQRRVAAPVFRPAHVESFIPAMLGAARDLRQRWSSLADGSAVEVSREMMQVTFDIILETMLSGRGDTDVARVETSIRDFLESTSWATALSMIGAPMWTPFPGKWRAERGRSYLRRIVLERIADRRRTGERRDDLLSLMLDARDPETGEGLDDDHVRDNILTFIGAGHETTALALTWTFYLLSRHTDVERRVLDEVAQVTKGGVLQARHLSELAYTRQVVQEAMRVYPPVPMIVRQPTRGTSVGGFALSPSDNVFIPIHAIHHHHRLWPDPEAFDPERFTPDAVKSRHRWSYLPFGAGPRICIGMGFAMLEAVAILATLLPTARLTAPADFTPTPKQRITMRPAEGMTMRIHRRA